MKNLFKFGFLAFAITLSVSACTSNKTESSTADTIDSVANVESEALENQADTVDSAAEARVDSIKQD